jgi:hypothetical protein
LVKENIIPRNIVLPSTRFRRNIIPRSTVLPSTWHRRKMTPSTTWLSKNIIPSSI